MANRKCYRFFDITVSMDMPSDLGLQWDQMYGRFADVGSIPSDRDLSIILWEGSDITDGAVLEAPLISIRIGEKVSMVARDRVLLHLQDILQNHILPSVRSHVLWHGAVWDVEGQGVMILADSGVGKTTLSLAEMSGGGNILSDEIAAMDPNTSRLIPFPRALSVRLDSLVLCGVKDSHQHVMLEEEKVILPMRSGSYLEDGVPLTTVVILDWPKDEAVKDGGVVEICVLAADERWKRNVSESYPDSSITSHPDGRGWWRCHSQYPLNASIIERAVKDAGAALSGFHRHACRAPTYTESPRFSALTAKDAAEKALSFLINGITLAETLTAPRLMGLVRGVMQQAQCVQCVPGKLNETLSGIRNLVTGKT